MSFDVFLQRFTGGDAAAGGGAAARAVLEPLAAEPVDGGFARIVTDDGEADVHGLGSDRGLMVNHASGESIWQVVVDVAVAADYAVLPVGCAVCVPRADMVADLPPELRDDVVVVRSGADLQRAITG